MKIITFLIISFCAFSGILFAGDPVEKEVISKINSVTVFITGAQINRSGEVNLAQGNTTLKFVGLSPKLRPNSIQVKADNGNVTILSVIHQLNYTKEQAKSEEIKTLEASRGEWQNKMERANKALMIVAQEAELLNQNRNLSGTKNGVEISELKAASEFFHNRRTELGNADIDYRKQLADCQAEMVKIDNQLIELRAKRDLATGEIFVNVTVKSAQKAVFSFSYAVDNASWTPAYDLRVESISKPVELTYKANVTQLSGEDWKDVKLTLSTGNPQESGSKPTLQPWWLSFYQPPRNYAEAERGRKSYSSDGAKGYITISGNVVSGNLKDENGEGLIGAVVLLEGYSIGAATDENGDFKFTLPAGVTSGSFRISYIGYQNIGVNLQQGTQYLNMGADNTLLEDVVIVAGAKREDRKSKKKRDEDKKTEEEDVEENIPVPVSVNVGMTSIDFAIELPYTVLSDGKNYGVDIKQHSVPAQYEYYCAPKLDLSAFLTAKITNWEGYNLLSGKANIYFEGTYLGESYLDVTTLDTLELSLGRDKNIVVTREKKKEFTKKQVLGGNKRDTKAYEISIRNKKTQAINITIEDQLPVPSNNDIKIEDINTADAKHDAESGKLTWKMTLSPSTDKKWTFGYTVKYPKDKFLSGYE